MVKNHYNEKKTLCLLRARGRGQDLNGQNPLNNIKISLPWPLKHEASNFIKMLASTNLELGHHLPHLVGHYNGIGLYEISARMVEHFLRNYEKVRKTA